MTAPAVIDTASVEAVLFDMDGVLTDTASVHLTAWSRLFDDALPVLAPDVTHPPFSAEDYRRLVDGRARIDGVEAVLADRGITLPRGTIDGAPGLGSAWALANRKNEHFHEAIATGGVATFPTSITVLDAVRDAGVPTAVVTASRNRVDILAAAGLSDAFDAAVDGVDIEDQGLAGKPAPDTFLEAARRLDVDPARAVVVEDAVSGVAAGKAGGFGLVIGVARHDDPDALLAAGAHVVVPDLAQVTVL
ncbi:MAG TPA: beta-phosphoglucomutase family hydrolase [Iamia sp.]|nr:beta-phosphoglucomutase family hydrolase [Iamia sp.]